MIVCRIKKVRNPEIKVAPIMMKIFISKTFFIASKSPAGDCKYFSTAVKEFPISRGANSEKILAMMVIKKPKRSFVRYFKKYLFRY